MLNREEKIALAIRGNQFMQERYNSYLQGYPEAERMLRTKLTDNEKLQFLAEEFKIIFELIVKDAPDIFGDLFLRALLFKTNPHLHCPNWHTAIKMAETKLIEGS